MAKKRNNDDFDILWKDTCSKDDFHDDIKWHEKEHVKLRNLISKYIDILLKKQQTVSILEIGCGSAIDSYLVANQYGSQVSFVGVDLSPYSIELASKVGKYFKRQIDLDVDDATASKFQDQSFDLIFSQGVIEHFKDTTKIMSEQKRLLKDGGVLIIDVPQKYNILTIYKHFLMLFGKWRFGWETQYSCSKLRSLGESFELKCEEMMGFGYFYRKDPCLHIRRMHKYIQKINVFRDFAFSKKLEDKYERFCETVEEKYGHKFLLHISGIFTKL